MNIIPFSGESLTMSSREIAELTGKEHKNVLADIRNMLEKLGKTSADFSADLPDAYGRMQPGFRLDRELTLTLVSGYDIPLRHRVVTRLAELEQKAAFAGLPDFSNPAVAARAWAEQVEQKALIEKQRDEAIATKAQIGSRRSQQLGDIILPPFSYQRESCGGIFGGILFFKITESTQCCRVSGIIRVPSRHQGQQ